jgi:hypothetical protein
MEDIENLNENPDDPEQVEDEGSEEEMEEEIQLVPPPLVGDVLITIPNGNGNAHYDNCNTR